MNTNINIYINKRSNLVIFKVISKAMEDSRDLDLNNVVVPRKRIITER